MAYQALLLDNDGILTHPTPDEDIRRAIRAAFATLGVADPLTQDVDRLVDGDVDDIVEAAARYDLDPEQLWIEREREATQVQQSLMANGGKPLYDDVATLAEVDLPTAIISNNQHETIEFLVDHFDLDRTLGTRLAHFVGRDPTLKGVRRKKPAPHYIAETMERMGIGEALYVGDSRVDIKAANALGIDSAFVRRPHRKSYALDVTPTVECASLEEVITHLKQGPIAQS